MLGKRVYLCLSVIAAMAFLPLNASFAEDLNREVLKAELKKELKAELADEIAAEIRAELKAEMKKEARVTVQRASREARFGLKEELKSEIMADTETDIKSQLAEMVKESPLISALKGVNISGFVDTNYFYNFRLHGDEGARQNALSGGNLNFIGENENNSVTLESFTLFLDKEATEEHPVGFQYHQYVGEKAKAITFLGETTGLHGTNDVDRDDIFTVAAANISWNAPIGKGITFTFGKIYTWIGLELVENINNPNYQHGILYNNAIPFTHTGLKIDFSSFLPDSLSFSVYGVNGWDSYIDNNESKSIGWYLSWQPIEKFFISLAGIHGAEGWDSGSLIGTDGINPRGAPIPGDAQRRDSSDGLTQMFDVVATWQTPHDPLTFMFNFDWGTAEDGSMDQWLGIMQGSTGHWWGVAGYALYDFTDWCQGVVRAEYFDDTDGVRWFDQSISEVTVTANIKVRENLLIRPEYRVNHFSSPTTGSARAMADDNSNPGIGDAHNHSLNDTEHIFGVGIEYLF